MCLSAGLFNKVKQDRRECNIHMKYKILKKVLAYVGGGVICGYIYRSLKKYTLLTNRILW